MYRCYLCSIASLTANTVGSHVVSAKHRKNYLAVQHPQMFKQLTHKSKNDSLISVFAHIFWIESFDRHLDNFSIHHSIIIRSQGYEGYGWEFRANCGGKVWSKEDPASRTGAESQVAPNYEWVYFMESTLTSSSTLIGHCHGFELKQLMLWNNCAPSSMGHDGLKRHKILLIYFWLVFLAPWSRSRLCNWRRSQCRHGRKKFLLRRVWLHHKQLSCFSDPYLWYV